MVNCLVVYDVWYIGIWHSSYEIYNMGYECHMPCYIVYFWLIGWLVGWLAASGILAPDRLIRTGVGKQGRLMRFPETKMP